STYSLSVAYISLSATTPTRTISNRPGKEQGEDRQAVEVFEDKDHLMEKGDPDGAALRVESALSGHPRVILSGGAGSGKTTLLQWLAVTASRTGFTDQLEEWNGAIPFVLPLRRFVGQQLPAPEDFIGINHRSLVGTMPPGWVHRTMAGGRAIVLIDGLDELPEPQRDDAREWLEELICTFPDARYVVTSRPLAVSRDWHELPEFRSAELLPMQRSDIREFIGHWHDAARKGVDSTEDREALVAAERHLLSAVHEMPHIRALCTSPLLCALICALHRHNVNRLPQNRLELYDTALEMLVSSRDEERAITPGDIPSLTYAEKKAILSDFAAWLHENGESDAELHTFVERVKRKEQYLARPDSIDGQKLAGVLLQRSGVLRQPVEGRVDFVHRTFLEYLAAVQFVEDDAVGKIVDHAHLDQWREVAILAAGIFPAHRRERLLSELVERGRRESECRHRLFLLAVASQETATTLSTELQLMINGCLDEVLPPENMTDAAAVASAGNLAVSRLGSVKGMRATTAAACVRALALIGTDEALAQLRSYSSDRRLTVHRQLMRAWGQFDSRAYAEEVLAASPLGSGHIVLSDPEQQRHLDVLANVKSAWLDFAGKIDSLDVLTPSDVVSGLNACRARGIEDLRSLSGFPNLDFLFLENSPSLRSLEGIGSCPKLRTVYLDNNPNLEDLAPLSQFQSFERLHITYSKLESTDLLRGIGIDELRIGGECLRHLSQGASMNVRQLHLQQAVSLENLEEIRTWESLEFLNYLHHSSGGDGRALAVPPRVKHLSISVGNSILNVAGAESVEGLRVYGREVSLPPLPNLSDLEASADFVLGLVVRDPHLSSMPNLGRIYVYGERAAEVSLEGFDVVRRVGRPVYSATLRRIAGP
ncbi:NACHT domain-containing protein, partial [Nocardioides kongjuensis]